MIKMLVVSKSSEFPIYVFTCICLDPSSGIQNKYVNATLFDSNKSAHAFVMDFKALGEKKKLLFIENSCIKVQN